MSSPRMEPGRIYFKSPLHSWSLRNRYLVYSIEDKTAHRVKADLVTILYKATKFRPIEGESLEATVRKIRDSGWTQITPRYLRLDEGI